MHTLLEPCCDIVLRHVFIHDYSVSCSDINFTINFLNRPGTADCRGPANFDEGVELAVSNPDSAGEWIPLHYFAPAHSGATNSNHSITIEVINSTAVYLRGYQTSYAVSRSRLHAASVSLCGQHVRNEIQLRWLQTTSFTSKNPPDDRKNLRDLWTLDGVTVTLHTDSTNSVSLLEEETQVSMLAAAHTIQLVLTVEPLFAGALVTYMYRPPCHLCMCREAVLIRTLCVWFTL